MSGPISQAIRERFGFDVPPEFNQLEARNAFFWDNARKDELIKSLAIPGEHYIWVQSCEWLQPDGIREFEFPDYIEPVYPLSQFIPFAEDGCGNTWCWWTGKADENGVPVVMCTHDDYEAEFHAFDFKSFLFERAVSHAYASTADAPQEEIEENRAILRRLATDLAFIWPPEWSAELLRISEAKLKTWRFRHLQCTGLLSEEDKDRLLLRTTKCPVTLFKWRTG